MLMARWNEGHDSADLTQKTDPDSKRSPPLPPLHPTTGSTQCERCGLAMLYWTWCILPAQNICQQIKDLFAKLKHNTTI
jgi:hypothetical protein